MSRYQWPLVGGEKKEDSPGERARFMARRRVDADPEGAQRAARSAPVSPQGHALRAPASGRQHLWQPLGPQTVLAGQAAGDPRITGRINALAVHPDGQRLYAASGNGGVWYSGDGGANWASLGGLAATDAAGIKRPAHRHACNAVTVAFGATAAADVVYVGTGEVTHPFSQLPGDWASGQPGRPLGGVGVLRAEHPATTGVDDPWVREAPNLGGTGIYKIAVEPGGSTVIAATLTGLWQRPAGGGAGVDWVRPTGTPFDALAVECTDLLWTAGDGTRPARLWVWVERGPSGGLWVRDAGQTNFTQITTPGTNNRRAALAASTPPDQVWVLNDRPNGTLPLLYRVAAAGNATPVATVVAGVPDILKTQGFYDIAIDVHPTNANRVVLGGSFMSTTTPEGQSLTQEGAVVVGDVALNAGVLTFGHPTPFSMVGIGIHADIHGVYWSNAGNRLWTACDGGVFRSDQPLRPAGAYACNNGLQVVESNYLASPPRCEGYVAVGLQDNASIQRRSNGVWTRVPRSSGDGGGILPRPLHTQHLIYQYVQANWSTSDGVMSDPDMLTRLGAYTKSESDASAFYSTAAGIATTRTPAAPNLALAVGQVIFGTTRVWYTEETRQLVPAAVETPLGTNWFTLPTGSDPLPAANTTQDAFGEAITVCRWQDPNVAWVLGEGTLMRYARVPGSDNAGPPGTWSRETIIIKGEKNKKDTTSADGPVRDSPVWTDIAVNLNAPGTPRGTRGAVYLGTVGKEGNTDVDTLWWFDGTSKWFKTGLRNDPNGTPAAVTALVCDANFADEVYVGTTVGVWKGVRTQAGTADPAWTWHKRLNALPEAAVEDLAIFSDGTLRLLRAAIAARGVWELRLDVEDVQDLTYVRVHDDDLRYRAPAVNVQRDGTTLRSWHGSPDVRPRTAITDLPAPGGNWSIESFQRAGLQRFQAALRAKSNDPRVRANGQWDAYFSEVLRDLGAPVVALPAAPPLPARNLVSITPAFWNLQMQPPFATTEPWGTGTPTEADLIEFTPSLTEGTRAQASCTLPRRASKVDIVVHHRGLNTVDGANVRVILLRWIDPRTKNAALWSDAATWFTGSPPGTPVPWTPALNEALNSTTGATSLSLGAGWSFVGNTLDTRRRTLAGQTLDPLHSGVVTFDIDLAPLRNNRIVLLVAVIRVGTDIVLAPDTLENLAMNSPHVAVRSMRVNP